MLHLWELSLAGFTMISLGMIVLWADDLAGEIGRGRPRIAIPLRQVK